MNYLCQLMSVYLWQMCPTTTRFGDAKTDVSHPAANRAFKSSSPNLLIFSASSDAGPVPVATQDL